MAKEHLLLPSQRNEIYELVRLSRLDPLHFELQEEASRWMGRKAVSKLVHLPSNYFCKFDVYNDHSGDLKRHTVFSPSDEHPIEERYLESWADQLDVCRDWLKWLRREVEAPDLWSCTTNDNSLAVAVSYPEDDNTSFSQTERQDIAAQLGEIRRLILASTELNQEKIDLVEGRLTYLQDSSQRLGRKDWKNLALGVVFTILIQLALGPDASRELWRLISALLIRLFGGPAQLPM